MSSTDAQYKTTIGFITVVKHPQHGLFGGYLILNLLGRPLEFHCTAPIKPNRAQEILYGPTLDAFLYGEQIGQTLLNHTTLRPRFVCTDQIAALCVRQHVEIPVVLVESPGGGGEATSPPMEDGEKIFRLDPAQTPDPHWIHFTCGRNRLAVPAHAEGDRSRVTEQWSEVAETFDLSEPFARIREAIAEAQQAA
jgi:hypothetical protein